MSEQTKKLTQPKLADQFLAVQASAETEDIAMLSGIMKMLHENAVATSRLADAAEKANRIAAMRGTNEARALRGNAAAFGDEAFDKELEP